MNDAIPLIRLSRLTKHYGPSIALQDLDLQIAKGEIFGILGPNGAGKTTLIRMLAIIQNGFSGSSPFYH